VGGEAALAQESLAQAAKTPPPCAAAAV